MAKHYAIYKGETFLFEGTAKECAGPLSWCENWKKRKIGETEWKKI